MDRNGEMSRCDIESEVMVRTRFKDGVRTMEEGD